MEGRWMRMLGEEVGEEEVRMLSEDGGWVRDEVRGEVVLE